MQVITYDIHLGYIAYYDAKRAFKMSLISILLRTLGREDGAHPKVYSCVLSRSFKHSIYLFNFRWVVFEGAITLT